MSRLRSLRRRLTHAKSDAHPAHDVTQNATQQVAATDGTEQKPMLKDGSFAEELPLDAAARHSVLREEVPPQGLEP